MKPWNSLFPDSIFYKPRKAYVLTPFPSTLQKIKVAHNFRNMVSGIAWQIAKDKQMLENAFPNVKTYLQMSQAESLRLLDIFFFV